MIITPSLRYKRHAISLAIILFANTIVFGQAAVPPDSGSISMWTILLVVAGIAVIGFLVYVKMQGSKEAVATKTLPPPRTRPASFNREGAKKESLGKNAGTFSKAENQSAGATRVPPVENISQAKERLRKKMQSARFTGLPISSYTEIRPAKPFEELPVSDDAELLTAIETVLDEFEESEEKRGQALRVLSAHKAKNSIDALAQAAFYDVSANLRSRAVTMLTDFDHESVFEPILLACADPGREVRASAARGLFKLSCDRANAWTRIWESNDEFRMKNSVRAAEEANIVKLSFDRLVHEDLKMSYEAFVLTALLVRSGETELLFFALKTHTDPTVRQAILHVLDIAGDERVVEPISNILSKQLLTADLAQKAGEVMRKYENVVLETF